MKAWVFTALLISEALSAEALLRVRSHIVVSPGSEVKLAQLVDAHGCSEEIQKRMQTIAISTAPAMGERQELAGSSLTAVLRQLIQDARKASKMQIVIPKNIVIDTVKHELSEDLVKAELQQVWQPLCADCQIEIEALSLPKVTGIRDWTLRLRSELPRGGFSVAVDLIREDGSPLPAWISGRLLIKRKVPVAKRLLQYNERIQEPDIAWEYCDTFYSIDGIPTQEDLVGKRVKQSIRVSDVIWKNNLERERVVRRGDLVQIVSSQGSWEVSMSAVAQQDAFIGDVISLKNPSSNNVLTGKVTGLGEVELR